MAGRQAKILTDGQLLAALRATRKTRYPTRDRVMLLLSAKAGLRAAEIAGLTWSMVLDADGRLGDRIALANDIAKKGSGRFISCSSRSILFCEQRSVSFDATVAMAM